jgi:hypothetical protein
MNEKEKATPPHPPQIIVHMRPRATVNQHSPAHHPLDACDYAVVNESQLS